MILINGASITSKTPSRMLTELRAVESRGNKIKLQDGRWYLDFECGLSGPLYGYRPGWWVEAMNDAILAGPASSIAHANETAVAKLLGEFVPDGEAIRWLLSGSDACACAAKLSRAFTGRESLLSYGYHGSATMYCEPPGAPSRPGLAVEDNRWGTTQSEKALFAPLKWLGEWDKTKRHAAIVVECPPNDGGRETASAWLTELARWAHDTGALFVLDEVVTGFRYGPGGASEYYQIQDLVDLYCYGKAISNGYPISCIVGKQAVMDCLREMPAGGGRCHYSGTWFGEPFGLATVKATLAQMKCEPPWGYIQAFGTYLKAKWNELPIPWKLVGHPTRPIIDPDADMAGFNDLRRYLFDRFIIIVDHPWFSTTAHSNADVDVLVRRVKDWMATG